jgi:stage II sporulation protein D
MVRLLLVALVAFFSCLSAAAQDVRARILDGRSLERVTFVAEGAPATLEDASGRTLSTVPVGRSVTLDRRGQSVRSDAGGSGRLTVVAGDGGRVAVRAGAVERVYRGRIAVDVDKSRLRLINHVPLDDYVAAVVAGEYPFEEIEGVKAQAILARTYALRSRGKYGDYDVVDGTGSQVYFGADRETPVTRRAARETAGRVLTYDGTLAEAVYFSSSGGHTTNNEHVWSGAPLPYLRGVPDPYDAASPYSTWTSRVSRTKLLRALTRRFGGPVTGIGPGERAPEGRFRTVVLYGGGGRTRHVPANQFRSAVAGAFGVSALRSAFFEVDREGSQYVFTGKGFGHGVGMSQFGARGQALAGRRHDEILAFYFGGTRLEQWTGEGYDPLPPVALTRPTRAPDATVEPLPVPGWTSPGASGEGQPRRTGW